MAFDGFDPGEVTVGGVKEIIPDWWGLDRKAIESAIAGMSDRNIPIQFLSSNKYTVVGAIKVIGSSTRRMIHFKGLGPSWDFNPENFGAVIEHSGPSNLFEFESDGGVQNVRVLIEDLIFIGDGTNSQNALDFSTAASTNVAEWEVSRCQFWDFKKSIYGRGNVATIRRCYSRDGSDTHIHITNKSISVDIIDNHIGNSATTTTSNDGILVEGGNFITDPDSTMRVNILFNTVDKGGRAYRVVDIHGGLIMGNYAESTAGAIYVEGTNPISPAASPKVSRGVRVVDNSTQSCQFAWMGIAQAQILVGNAIDTVIDGNTIKGGSSVSAIVDDYNGSTSTNTIVGNNNFPDGHTTILQYNSPNQKIKTQTPKFPGQTRTAAATVSLTTGDTFPLNHTANNNQDINTINNFWDGRVIWFFPNPSGGGSSTITLRHDNGNILCSTGANIVISEIRGIQLIYDGIVSNKWMTL